MKWSYAPIALLMLAITVVTIVSLKGGERMSLLPNDPKAGIGLPSSNMHASGSFETATFALG